MVSDAISCPFCGARVVLRESPIVATNIEGEREAYENGHAQLASGSEIIEWLGEWPVVLWPEDEDFGRGSRLLRHFRRLPAATELAAPEDLPAYACVACKSPLPEDAGERPLLTIAVVGAMFAGKSSYIASVIREAARRQRLRPYGWSEFALDEASAFRYHNDYYKRLFFGRKPLQSTQRPINGRDRFQPLSCRVTIGDSEPFVLLLHDVAGDVWEDRTARPQFTPFLAHADGVIFLIDPLQLEDLDLGRPTRPGNVNQADLLEGCMRQIGDKRLGSLPVVLTLSKSDLISNRRSSEPFAFARDASEDVSDWHQECAQIDREVQSVLAEAGAHDLLAAAERIPLHQFLAVAPLGSDMETPGAKVEPLRCLDPLVWIVAQL